MKKPKELWLKSLFAIYGILLVWIILFRMDFSISAIHRVRELHLIPFYYTGVPAGDLPLFESLLNVLIFMPFGVYLKMLGVGSKKIILSGFCLSLFFEVSQYIFRLGSSDVTDLITNTLGGIAGLYVYVLLCKLCKNRHRLDTVLKICATVVSCMGLGVFGLLWVASFRLP